MTTYYTLKDNVPIQSGQTLAFTAGKGYYAKGEPDGKLLSSNLGSDSAQTTNQTYPTGPVLSSILGSDSAQTSNAASAAAAQQKAAAAQAASGAGSGVAGGNGGQAAAAATVRAQTPVDWAQLLGEYGLPPDVVAELDRIFQTTGDINQAIPIAQAYVRGTAWYAQAYPGIQQGINAGLFNDESGYRQYKTQLDQIYQQYYGRDPTSGELSGYLTRGATITRAAAEFQSAATKVNFSDPLKAIFSDDELTALAQEQNGIDTALGQHVMAAANLYSQVGSLYQNFYGRAPTLDDINGLLKNGTSAADVAQQFATQENINAMNPAIRDLFTPDEIKQIALDAAGGVTDNGKQLTDLANLATGLNTVYHQYTGAGVSRQEVQDAYSQQLTPDYVGKQFAGAAFVNANKSDIQLTQGAFGGGQLDAGQLKSFGEENAGIDTPMGQQLTAAYSKAQARMNKVFQGVLAAPQLSLAGGKLSGQQAQKQPDVAA